MTVEVVRAPVSTGLEAHTVDAPSVGARRADPASEPHSVDECGALPALLHGSV